MKGKLIDLVIYFYKRKTAYDYIDGYTTLYIITIWKIKSDNNINNNNADFPPLITTAHYNTASVTKISGFYNNLCNKRKIILNFHSSHLLRFAF